MTKEIITISNSELTVKISTLGAEIQSVVGKNGTEFIWEGDSAVWSGRAPILFPICGDLKEDKYVYCGREYTLKRHGFVQHTVFDVENKTEDEVTLVCRANDATRTSYPFDFVFRAIFTLHGNRLTVTYRVENEGTDTMYFSVGAHEGYACPEGIEEYSLLFDETETLNRHIMHGRLLNGETVCVLERGKELPLKKEYFEIDAMIFKGLKSRKVQLIHRGGTKKVTLSYPGHDNFLIWTKVDARYVCLEPWCGIPDTVGTSYDICEKEGIIALGAGQTTDRTHTIEFSE